MTWNDLVPGDIIFKEPMGRFPIWLYLRPIGPKLGVYMNMETGVTMEATRSHDQPLLSEGWCLLRDGVIYSEAI